MATKDTASTWLIVYDGATQAYTWLTDGSAFPSLLGRPLWRALKEEGLIDPADAARMEAATQEAALAPGASFHEVCLLDTAKGWRMHRVGLVCAAPGQVSITLTDLGDHQDPAASFDELSRLMSRSAFCKRSEELLASSGGETFAMIYLDLMRFKVINDLFGRELGDTLLRYIGQVIRRALTARSCASRLVADKFVIFMPQADDPEILLDALQKALTAYDMPFEITFNAGIYLTTEHRHSANSMIDRATLAFSTIKGKYTTRFCYYTEAMRNDILSEQEITGMMKAAMAEGHFHVYYQPQYNHSTGMLIGAEGLVRWFHPEKGIISPAAFIPIFEKNGFITTLDLHVFEQVCSFLRRCINNHWAVVPISTNFSRYDIFTTGFVDKLEAIRQKYDVPTKLLRVELTESAMMGGPQFINEIIEKLHRCGYIVEMDDFGSGYSSLNVLKDIDLDIIKLDMQFMAHTDHANKGGTILSSIIRMAKWLSMPVIAEGVETVEQADFLRSIGCDYIQGYLYSRPLPEGEYVKLISGSSIGAMVPQANMIENFNSLNFWDPASQETLIFSNYVGAACIFLYHDGKIELLRVNKKYLQELGMNLSEKELIQADPLATMDKENQDIYLKMLNEAIRTKDEQECDAWRTITSPCCGSERFCIRSTVRVIGTSGGQYLFHGMIRNITAERLYCDALIDNERRIKVVTDQMNVYYWEYTVATHEMRPCHRCMRDLGLPPLLTNYPQPAFDRGIFPMDYYDLYWDWHRQIEAGVPYLEAIIPLTPDRIPFRVRYTTEFDENGHAVKAYGSAELITE